ncbi:MAG: YHS domain-containing protein [Oxalobacteraceae bacterium]|nr:YHS domain-containing protein [Oxalobacteraceae bacterium]
MSNLPTEFAMLALAPQLIAAQRPFALATVIRVSAPSSTVVGAQAIIEADGTLHGWVGGGCAKAVVVQAAQQAIGVGLPRRIRISNDGALSEADVEQHAMPCASNGTLELFIQPVVPAPLLVVLGATPAAAEARVLGQRMGLRVSALADSQSDLAMLELLQPAFVLIVTQGEGDEAALDAALRSSCPAVLLIASPRKAAQLRERMQLQGIAEDRLAVLQAPAGPYLHARTPAEVALGAIAAVVALRRTAEAVVPVVAAPAYVNPVCGMAVDPATAKHVIAFGGMSHYFCCDGCKLRFEDAPDKYLAIARGVPA